MLNEKEGCALVQDENKVHNDGWSLLLLLLAFSNNEEELEGFLQKVIQVRESIQNTFFDVVKKHSKVAHLSRHGKKRVKKKNQKRLIKLVCKEIGFGKETTKIIRERVVDNG